MEALTTFFSFLFLIAGVLALLSFFIPNLAFFLKDKTRTKAMLSWLALALIGFVGVFVTSPDESKGTAQNQASQVEMDEEPAAWIRETAAQASSGPEPASPEKVEAARQEIVSAMAGLDALRNQSSFWELGFSSNNYEAIAWKAKVEAMRERFEADESLPASLRAAPGLMLVIGLEWQRNQGLTTDLAKDLLEQIFMTNRP